MAALAVQVALVALILATFLATCLGRLAAAVVGDFMTFLVVAVAQAVPVKGRTCCTVLA